METPEERKVLWANKEIPLLYPTGLAARHWDCVHQVGVGGTVVSGKE